MQRGAASARADPKEPVAQGEAAEVTPTQAGEGAPLPYELEARGSDEVEASLVAEATEVEAPRTSKAKATEAGVPRTAEAALAGATARGTTEATMAEAGAPGTTEAGAAEADVIAAKPVAWEVEMKMAEASVPPLVQGLPLLWESAREVEVHSISSGDTSQGREGADAEAVSTMEQPAPASELETKVTRAAEASVAVQTVLETEIGEHDTLKSAARTACEALEVEGVQSGSSLGSSLITLSGQVRERLRGALHMGVKRALAIIASHDIGVNLKAISDGYILPDDDGEVNEEVAKLMEAAKGPGTTLAKLFEEEVVPPTLSANAGDPEP
ncbi:uncharacterized protein [Miscanthus floridulus]|uniref:uncharacterized protein n=1 Tax=Miscanthus floridulus TaxID=154761 RepID=UPI003458F90C